MARFSSNRKTTPKVRNGKVQKKNRHQPTRQNSLLVGLEKTRRRHVLTKEDIWKFLRLIPDWKRVSTDLDLIFLASGTADEEDCDGWYDDPYFNRNCPQIGISAWEADLKYWADEAWYEHHRGLFNRLGLPLEEDEEGYTYLQFDEDSAKAFQLLHILLHELGHHHYRITKGRGKETGDEKYAEAYAYKLEKQIWPRYREAFHFHPTPIEAE